MKLTKLIFIVYILLSGMALGQGESNIWYFGENGGLDFSTTPPTVIAGLTGVEVPTGLMETAASISDANGNLLFAVVGKDIYSADGVKRGTLPNGTYHETAQGAMIIPVPGNTTEFYISTVPRGSGCTSPSPAYVKVTTSGITGNNISIAPPVSFPTSNVGHGQMIVPKTDVAGNPTGDHWLVHHARNSSDFHVYSITSAGISFVSTISNGPNMVTDCSGIDHIAYFKSNGCYNQFAYSYGNNTYLFDFDTQTGTMGYQNSVGPIAQAYGVEFSPNGKYIYISTGTTGGQSPRPVYRVPVTPGGLAGSTLGTATSIGTMNVTRGGAMQIGPDGVIYIAGLPNWNGVAGTNYLGTISNPDGGGTFNGTGVTMPNTIIGMGIPSFPASLVANVVKIIPPTICENEVGTFSFLMSGTEQTPPERLWQFFSTATATGTPVGTATTQTATHSWPASGTYAVTLQVKDICGRLKYDTIQMVIDPTQVADGTLAACPSRVVTGTGSTSGMYAWYTADPTSGGTFLGYGATYDAAGLSNVWVQPTGSVTITNPNDTRTPGNWGSSTGNTSITVASGAAAITSFSTSFGSGWSASNNVGNFIFTLKNAGGTVVGNPITVAHNSPAGAEYTITGNATDWNVGLGTYTIEVTSPGWALIRQLSTANSSSGALSYTGGQTSAINTTHYVENAVVACYTGKLVTIPSCCTQLKPTIAQTTGVPVVCVGEAVELTVTPDPLTTGPITYQWYSDAGLITGETGLTYTVPTTSSAAITNYWAVVTSSASCSGDSPASDSLQVTINPKPTIPTITINPNQTTFCENVAHDLTAASTVTGGGIVSYIWSNAGSATAANQTGTVSPGGTYTYKVIADVAGCQDSAEQIIIVSPLDSAKITPDTVATCANVGNIDLSQYLTGGSSAGTWSGTSVTGTDFSTVIAGGVYKVVFATGGTCPTKDSMYVNVTNKITSSVSLSKSTFCANESAELSLGTPGGGVYWGFGITSGVTGNFDPSTATAGTDTIFYGITGSCGDTSFVEITVNAIDSAKVIPVDSSSCANLGNIDLSALITGGTSAGTWSGTNVTGTNFSTATTGATYNVVYTTSGSCPTKDSLDIIITDKITASVSLSKTTFCANEPTEIASGSPSGGTYWGYGITNTTGTFDPSTATWNPSAIIPGTDTIFYGIASACGDTAYALIGVDSLDLAQSQDAIPSACSIDPAFSLTLDGGTTGGVWTDSLGANTYVSLAGLFNPAGLTDGLYKVYYATRGNCPAVDSSFVRITSNISFAYQISNDTTLCLNYGLDTLDVDVAGGIIWTKSGLGVVDAAKLIFDTRLMVAGVDTIWYGKAGACGDTVAYEYTISPIDVAVIDQIGPFCADDATGKPLTITGAGVGGTWSGAGVTGSTFTSSTAGAGIHDIIYITAGACPIQDTIKVTVLPRAVATITGTPPNYCNGFPLGGTYTGAESGGTWSGWTGSWNLVAGTDSAVYFNSSIASGVDSLYYEITGTCGAKDSIIITVSANDVALITPVSDVCVDGSAINLTLDATATPGGAWADSSGSNVYTTTAGLFTPSLATAGTYKSRYITNTTGCPDTAYVSVVVKPRADATISSSIPTPFCSNGSSTTLTGVDPGGLWTGWTGSHTSDASNVLTFDPTLSGGGSKYVLYSINETSLACGDTDSVQVVVTPLDIASITGQELFCQSDGSAPMTLSANSTTGGNWAGAGVNISTGVFNPTGAVNLLPDSNLITYTTSGACPVLDTIFIKVTSAVTIDIDLSKTPLIVCSNGADTLVVLTSTSTQSPLIKWSSTPITVVDQNGKLNLAAMAADLNNDTYVIKASLDFGGSCKDEDQVTVRMITLAGPTFEIPSSGICVTNGTHQFANASKGELWTVLSGSATISQTGLATFSSSGESEIAYIHTGEGVCADTLSATLSIVDPIDASIETGKTPICDNLASVSVGSSIGHTGGTWNLYSGSLTGTPISSSSTGSINIDPKDLGAGTYVIEHITTNGRSCTASDDQTFTIFAAPTPIITAVDPTVCLGEPIVYQVDNDGATLSTTASPNSTWIFEDGLPMDSIGQVTKVHSSSDTTDKTVILYQKFSTGCEVRDTVNLATVDAIPQAAFTYTPYQPTVLDPKIQFLDESEFAHRLEWSFGGTASPAFSAEENPYVKFDTRDGDTIEVCLAAFSPKLSGCKDTVCKDVVILNNLSVYIPNSFTPNGDGLNDVFYPLGTYHDNAQGLSEYEFMVYNRWGELIFKSTKPYTGWDGFFLGDVVPQEVYVWIIKVYDPVKGGVRSSNGTVTVVK